jgi:hypothetical protein
MTEVGSVELLLQGPTSSSKEYSEGEEAAATIGYSALTLEQAGAYVRSQGSPLNQFRCILQKAKNGSSRGDTGRMGISKK